MGAMLGRFFGRIAYRFLPGIVAPSGAYALVGMAAVFAGAAQAPITSFFILFEMTGSPQMSVIELIKKLNKMGHHGLPVVDEGGHLCGMVTLSDVESRIAGDIKQLTVADIATTKLITVYPDQPLSELVDHLGMGTGEIPRIPVVSRGDPTKLMGILRRQDIIKGYAKIVMAIHESKNEDFGY